MMKHLGNLSPAPGSKHSRKRLGRGPGSGTGKTAGKGHKGQKARKGSSIVVGRKGNQRAMWKQIPKYGFKTTRQRQHFHEVNLDQLAVFTDGAVVSGETLVAAGVLGKLKYPVKILGRGSVERKLHLKVAKCSQRVRAVIETCGGSIQET